MAVDASKEFAPGERILHTEFGRGGVLDVAHDGYGQNHTAQVCNLVMSGTIEGRIFLMLEDKLIEIARTVGKVVLLTDGSSRTVRAGPMTIAFKGTTPRNIAAANRLSGLMIQAFKSLGPGRVTPQRIEHLRKTLPKAERVKLLSDLNLAPAWMRPLLQSVAADMPAMSKKKRKS